MHRNSDSIEPGVIDVLIPHQTNSSSYTLQPPVATRSYSALHYDSQRPVFVHNSIQLPLDSQKDAQFLSACAFEPYVRHSKPVKIAQVMSFRDKAQSEDDPFLTPTPLVQIRGDDLKLPESLERRHVDAVLQTTRFPLHLLHTQVQVLCASFPGTDTGSSDYTSAKVSCQEDLNPRIMIPQTKESPSISKKRKTTYQSEESLYLNLDHLDKKRFQLYNQYLSVLDPEQQKLNPTPVFLGQGHSVSTMLPLKDIFYQTFDHSDTFQVYIAQQSILSCRESGTISCHVDGRLDYQAVTKDDTDSVDENTTPLAALTPFLRAPTHLLPPTIATMVEVNFWYSPRSTSTNYHYDSNHNILIVLSGTKTIELSPPDTIRPAPLYSDHANHPALLHSHSFPSTPSTIPISIAQQQTHECQETRKRLLEKSFVVSISAGEAIFIPEGWWHRVESSDFCMAINLWFDHPNYSAASFQCIQNRHTMTFHIRELIRVYFSQQSKQVAQQLINVDKATWMNALVHEYGTQASYLCDIEQRINNTSTLFNLETWLSSDILTRSIISAKFNWLMLLLDPFAFHHRYQALNLLVYLCELCSKNSLQFSLLILGMESAQCYILSMIWEHHEKEIVEASCNALFERCEDKSHQCLQHIIQGADEFKRRVMVSLCQSMSIT